MLQTRLTSDRDARPLDMPGLVELLSQSSSRPRYAYMILDLIAKIAGPNGSAGPLVIDGGSAIPIRRSEEHTSELQSLMRIAYAVFCLKKKTTTHNKENPHSQHPKHQSHINHITDN